MNKESMIKIVGLTLIIMWVSRVPYLFPHPFQESKALRKLATDFMQSPDWIKQESGIKVQTADDLERSMTINLRIHWVKGAVLIAVGVLSGWWLVQGSKGGYLLAFSFSLLVIGLRLAHLVRYRRFTFSLDYYEFSLHHFPLRTIHDILMQLVLLGTVIFLMYMFVTRKAAHSTDNACSLTDNGDSTPL